MTATSGDEREVPSELEPLVRDYRRGADAVPPAELDAAVLARARAAVARRRRMPGWWVPATLAATVLVAFSLVSRVRDESAPHPAAGERARQSSESAEPAAPRLDRSSAETPVAPAPSAPAAIETAPASEALAQDRAKGDSAPAAGTLAGEASGTPAGAAPAAAMRAQPAAVAPAGPEAWLARIESLESAGRLEEAAAERRELEAAYPGWLAQHATSRD
jgi:hypothetical protein